jgi:hypothetical protein
MGKTLKPLLRKRVWGIEIIDVKIKTYNYQRI